MGVVPISKRLFALVLLPLFVISSFAAEIDEGIPSDFSVAPGVYVISNDTYTLTPSDSEPVSVDVSTFAVDPVTPSNTNGLKSVLLKVLGDYSAIQVEMRYTNTNGTYSYVREIQPDYVWMASAALFIVMIWSVFKLGGAFLCKK